MVHIKKVFGRIIKQMEGVEEYYQMAMYLLVNGLMINLMDM